MRLALFCFVLLRMCGADLAAEALVAHHGGVVVGAGDRAIEVVASSDGAVEAWVVDGDGAPIVASADPITLTLTSAGGARTPVVVVWDPTSTSYKATSPVPLVPGPIDVSIVVAGEPRGGHADTIFIVPAMGAPSTTVVVDAPSVRATSPRTTVVVERPQPPGVVVVAPPPRPSVVVIAPEPPRPPGVVIVGPRHPSPPGVVIVGPRPPSPPSIVFAPPRPPGVVIVGGGDRDDDRDDHHDHGRHRGHDDDHRGRGHGHGHDDD